jgi:hypothetical protein
VPNDARLWKFGVDVPQYLFRAFDDASSGQSDENMIASVASTMEADGSRINLLSLKKRTATRMLHGHLVKSLFGGYDQDKLLPLRHPIRHLETSIQ